MLVNLTVINTKLAEGGKQYINDPPPEKIIRELGWNQYPLPPSLTTQYTFFMAQHPKFKANSEVIGLWLNSKGTAMTANRVSSNVQAASWALGKYLCTPLDIRFCIITVFAKQCLI